VRRNHTRGADSADTLRFWVLAFDGGESCNERNQTREKAKSNTRKSEIKHEKKRNQTREKAKSNTRKSEIKHEKKAFQHMLYPQHVRYLISRKRGYGTRLVRGLALPLLPPRQ